MISNWLILQLQNHFMAPLDFVRVNRYHKGMKPSELSNDPQWWKTRVVGLSGSKRIQTKSLAVLIQNTRVTHRQMHLWNCHGYTRA